MTAEEWRYLGQACLWNADHSSEEYGGLGEVWAHHGTPSAPTPAPVVMPVEPVGQQSRITAKWKTLAQACLSLSEVWEDALRPRRQTRARPSWHR